MPEVVLSDLSYGRDGGDPVLSPEFPKNGGVEAQNVLLNRGELARKRNGCTGVALTSSTITTGPRWLIHHTTAAGVEELWAGNNGGATGIIARNTNGSGAWTPVSTPGANDNPLDSIWGRARGASFNNKLFFAYYPTGAVNRTHVWDGTSLRRTGLATPAAPTCANTGMGGYAATVRYYKVAYTVQSSGVTLRRSECSSVLTFTPSGSGTAAQVTKPATISEGETHWELYASSDNKVFYLIATTAVGTPSYDDSATPSAYTGAADPLVGTNTVPVACYYVLADESWLLWAREALGNHQARVYYTAALGSTDIGDDERIPNTVDEQNWLDLTDNDGDPITGLAGPFYGSILAFKRHAIWKLVRTGDSLAPYRPMPVPSSVGALQQETICTGEDEHGDQAVYFLSLMGPYRLGVNGVEYLGRDIEDLWATVDLSNAGGDFHGVYYAVRREVWWWVNTSAGWKRLRLSVRSMSAGRGGWTVDPVPATVGGMQCSVPYLPQSMTSAGVQLKPYSGGQGKLLKHDTGATDDGTLFQAYVKTRPMALGGAGHRCTVDAVSVIAPAAQTDVAVTLTADFGVATKSQSVSLAAKGAETHVQKKLDGCTLGGANLVQVTVGDLKPTSATWTVDAVVLPTATLEPR